MDAPAIAAIGLMVVLLVGFLLVRWPVAASLGIYAFLLPFDSILNLGEVGSIHLHLSWFVAALAGCVLLVRGFLGKAFVAPPLAVGWPVLIVFWGVISVWWAINADKALFRLPVIALFLFLYLAVACVRISEQELSILGWLAVLGACAAAALSIYQLHYGQSFLPSHPNLGTGPEVYELSGRETLALGGRETDPNVLASTLILPLSLAMGMSLSSKSWKWRWLLMGAVGAIALSIYRTESRGGMLGAAVVLLVFLWRSPLKRQLALPIALVAGIVMLRPGTLLSRMGEVSADRGSGRLDIWGVGWWALGRHPILGAGLDCFPDVYNQYAYAAANFMGFNRAPHNTYLGTAVELGTIGAALLIATLAGHYLLAANARREDSDESSRLRLISYEAAFCGLLVSALFIDLFWQGCFWFCLMLLVMGAGVVRAKMNSSSLHPEAFEYPAEALPSWR